ncbi:serine/threonine protein kinase [Micromonospora echinospora]|uniref:non-specific serine/threonine protein kinase n=1 Tax=Micromonospora echinospora TaxID=1877 RepID=A0A1C5A3D6_MICEC|nr:serine/threonine-protein kinase [Micromonospora echinospora]OZV83671.1 serine/threonine protein kinase [Micromonospora echinospora]SCF39708.1 serine/threonine protein kinase [Micromonospora echinospora]
MSPPFTPGLRLHDRFVLRARIGLGGMSEVWRADDEVLHRPVAVKALAGQLAADPELRATIGREARAAARLTHPHVTQVYDYGEATLAGGVVVPYLVMELVEGENLADRLDRGPLAWPDAVRLGGQVAAALAAAHRIGVVHHDVKPGNVMLTDTGAKVLDFGIAALAGPRHPRLGRDAGEPLMGTPAYLAPERLAAGAPDPASDVYALGALLYRTLTGRAPLPVRTWEDAWAVHGRGTPVPPLGIPELPADVDRLVMACLAADPTRRPAAADVATRLGMGRPAHPPTTILPTLSSPPAPVAPSPTLVARPRTPADRTLVGPGPAPGWSAPPTADPTRVAPRPAGAVPRPRGNRRIGVLVAAGLALVVALVGARALGEDQAGRSAADRGATGAQAGPAPSPTASTQAPRTARPAPTPARPRPTTLREAADQFVAVIDEAEARGAVDARVAKRLRDAADKLASGKPKDRAKRLRELREELGEAAQRQQIDGVTVARLLTTLERFVVTGVDGGAEDDEDEDDD